MEAIYEPVSRNEASSRKSLFRLMMRQEMPTCGRLRRSFLVLHLNSQAFRYSPRFPLVHAGAYTKKPLPNSVNANEDAGVPMSKAAPM